MTTSTPKLHAPWLVAVWPGMGNVAVIGGYYLMSKLGMHLLAEFSPRELFDAETVLVKDGIIHPGPLPRSRFFVWQDPHAQHDIVVFIGEAQPPVGKHAFCRKLLEFAKQLGVERIFTFAAMATQMHPKHESRVFAAATDAASLAELKRLELVLLEDGHIGGLNGVLLGVAAEQGLRGACLLGEMPHVFAQFPFPKASRVVLESFITLAGLDLDLTELSEQAEQMENKLDELLHQVEQAMEQAAEAEESYGTEPEPPEPKIHPDDERRLEQLFDQAQRNRAKSFELKQELDRLGVFADYEDRFLDLFKKRE